MAGKFCFSCGAKIPENCKLKFKILNRVKKQIEITGVIYEKHQI